MSVMTREEIMSKVYPSIVSRQDTEMLSHSVHEPVKGTDLTVVARVQGTDEVVTDDMRCQCCLTAKELMRAAMDNLSKRKYVLQPLNEMLGLPENPEETKLLVATNLSGEYGAGEVLNPKLQKEASEKLGGDFFILPSSIHECILVSTDCGLSVTDLNNMVHDINQSEVKPAERLSDSVYKYDFARKTIEMASDIKKTESEEMTQTRGRRM